MSTVDDLALLRSLGFGPIGIRRGAGFVRSFRVRRLKVRWVAWDRWVSPRRRGLTVVVHLPFRLRFNPRRTPREVLRDSWSDSSAREWLLMNVAGWCGLHGGSNTWMPAWRCCGPIGSRVRKIRRCLPWLSKI